MKKTSFLIATAMLIGLPLSFAQDNSAPEAPAENKQEEKVATEPAPQSPEELAKNIGYFFGYQVGQQMTQTAPIKEGDINMDLFMEGFKDSLNGVVPPKISDEVIRASLMQFENQIRERIDAAMAKNIEEGKKFLEENAKKEGVKKTESGLQYRVINKGGDKKYEAPKEGPDMGTRFKVNYKGTLPNGEVFDENREGEPAEFTLQLIPGFVEALKMMPVGAKWEIVLPSDLAYGANGAGAKIGPNQVLIFELELLDILPPDPNAPNINNQREMSQEEIQQLIEAMQQAEGEGDQK